MTFFVLSKRYDSLKNVDQWFSDTTKITRQEGLRRPELYFAKDGTISLIYECTKEEYERFKSKYNLIIDHIVDGIIFLKSNSFFLKGDYIYEIS